MADINSLLASEGDTSGAAGSDAAKAAAEATAKADADAKSAGKKPEPTADEKAKAEAEAKAKAEADAKAKPDAVPEKYEFKLPEGVKLDTALVDKFTPVAKELGLSNEKAQKLVDLFAASQQTVGAAQEQAVEKMRADWRTEIQADPKHKETLGLAKRALTLADADTAKMFTASWLGDHPKVIGFLAKIGSLLKEDTVIEGNAGGKGSGRSAEDILYPSKK